MIVNVMTHRPTNDIDVTNSRVNGVFGARSLVPTVDRLSPAT